MGQNGPPSTDVGSNTSQSHQRVVPVLSANLCTLCCKVQAMCKNTDNAPFFYLFLNTYAIALHASHSYMTHAIELQCTKI